MIDEEPLGLSSWNLACPWCGEELEWVVDPSNTEAYVEDCYVCCRPCILRPELDVSGSLTTVHIDCE